MNPTDLKVGHVVQLNPETCRNPMFGASFLVVTDTRDWGAQGYVQIVGSTDRPTGRPCLLPRPIGRNGAYRRRRIISIQADSNQSMDIGLSTH